MVTGTLIYYMKVTKLILEISISCYFQRKNQACTCGSKKTSKPLCSTSGCPCTGADRSCEFCSCKNCENPNGRSTGSKSKSTSRKSAPSGLDTSRKRSTEFHSDVLDGELLKEGRWSENETFLLGSLIQNASGILTQATILAKYPGDRREKFKIDHSETFYFEGGV